MDLSSLYSPDDSEDDFNDPGKFARSLGLINDYPSDPNQQLNYLDDNFGTFTRKLPIDQPSGSVVSGGREDLYHKYSQMLQQKPESESILENYLGRRPTREQFGNSLGRKLLAGLTGFTSGLQFGPGGQVHADPARSFAITSRIADEPFNEAMQDYNSEGRQVYDYAKLKESSRQRELAGMVSQIRMQETERANRAREAGVDVLRGIQSDREKAYAQGILDRTSEREAGRQFRQSQLEETTRHNKAMESLGQEKIDKPGRGTTNKPLSPEQQTAAMKLAQKRLEMSDPRYAQMLQSLKDNPSQFLSDTPPSDPNEQQNWANNRRLYSIYQSVMQQLMNRGGQ